MNTTPDFDNILNTNLQEFAIDLWNALWYAHKAKGAKGNINLTYWFDKAQKRRITTKDFNILLISLSNKNYIKSEVSRSRNWAACALHPKYLAQFTKEELITLRKEYGYRRYALPDMIGTFKGVKTYQGVTHTGLERKGFESTCSTHYSFDLNALSNHSDAITASISKGMDKVRGAHSLPVQETDYDELALDIVENLEGSNVYTLGDLYLDSRGRAVHGCLNSPMNPISNKLFRGAVKCTPKPITEEGTKAVFLFIAELVGSNNTSIEGKIQSGKNAWVQHTLVKDPDHDIWLERIYDNLDVVYGTTPSVTARAVALAVVDPCGDWDVPIELDASASMLGITGILLDDRDLLESCNIIGDGVADPWYVEGLPRKLVKTAYTPMLYGSSASPETLWDNANLEYTDEHVRIAKSNLLQGKFALANKFKSFVLSNVEPKETMAISIWGDKFAIYCNKYKRIGDKPIPYTLYDSEEATLKSIQHAHPKSVANLSAFRLYFQTLLIHNLDSQIMDSAIQAADLDWVIPIHDAVLVHPNDAASFRGCYGGALLSLRLSRKYVLQQFFTSTGITQAAHAEWAEVKALISPVKEFIYNPMVLK